MSGTSMDGIDAAFLETDGETFVKPGPYASMPYPADLRRKLLSLQQEDSGCSSIGREVTELQARAVQMLCASGNINPVSIDLVGFHGQTIKHDPREGRTWQLGDGRLMADMLNTVVVNNFRQNDMDHGGQGAPLVPAYHRAIVRSHGIAEPVAVLNIGGVSNVTLIDAQLLYACDCGPGNALIDDWVGKYCHVPYDDRGRIARAGRVHQPSLATLLSNPYFAQSGPKSLDRNTFSADSLSGLSPEDGAATLSAFTAAAVAIEAQKLPVQPKEWIVVGGGRLNDFLIAELRQRLHTAVRIAEGCGWAGGAIEAQAFGYLAVRSVLQLPLSWPTTTGVREPVTGGVRWTPATGSTRMGAASASIRAVLFDLDGTLLDTAPDMASSLNALRREEGLTPLPLGDIRPMVSHGAAALIRLAFPQAAEGELTKLRGRFLAIYRDRLAVETRPYPGLLDSLADLESRGIPWGIVTNKPGWLTVPLLEQLRLNNRAGVVVSGDTLAERKPHPAPLLHAAERLGVPPRECIYIGDAERDVLAAQAAGMDVFVALFGYIPRHERPDEWPANGWLDSPQALAQLLASIRNSLTFLG